MDKNGPRRFDEGGRKAHTRKEKYRNSLTIWAEAERGVVLKYFDTFG